MTKNHQTMSKKVIKSQSGFWVAIPGDGYLWSIKRSETAKVETATYNASSNEVIISHHNNFSPSSLLDMAHLVIKIGLK